MEIRLLGPVELHAGGGRLEIRPRQRLVVLAGLAMDAGLVVSADTLIRRVWEKPPKQARQTLHAHVSHLRGVLRKASAADPDQPAVQLVHRSVGYVLQIDRERVDLYQFRALVARAACVPDEQAATLLEQALQLWRGEALAGLDAAWPQAVRTSLQRERLTVELDRYDVRLRLGQHAHLIDALADAAAAHPHDERLAGQYLLALYRCGRQADALAHYERIRRRLDNRVAVLSPPLRELRQKILNGDPAILRWHPAATTPDKQPDPQPDQQPPPKAERTLPADVAGFVGRDRELRYLMATLDVAAGEPAPPVVIHAVDGMPGVGKTAFAVHAAHRLAARFPDGQRFVELRAHAPGQAVVGPAEALEILLQADGVAAQQIPAGLDARAGLWRERIADRKMLLVLDDAGDAGDVAPLLPAAPGCLVLITSRRRLATLPGVTLLSLDSLPPADAARLFVHRAGPRARDDAAAVERIVELCGYLPLAITLTAARLQLHPAWTVDDLADDLADARDRLAELACGELTVATAFDLSYRDLPADRQRLLRRLALHPGPDFDAYAAAALDGTALATARRGLEGLLEHNLLSEPHRGRYRLHDLIGAYARTRVAADPEPERDAAIDRLLTYYLCTAAVAVEQLTGSAPPVAALTAADPPAAAPTIADVRQAADWFVAEHSNLAAGTATAATRNHPAAIGIPLAMYEHLRNRGPVDLALRLHHTAVAAARQAGDRASEAHALINLSHTHRMTTDYPSAAAAAERASALFQRLGDVTGFATALCALAFVRGAVHDYPASTAAVDQARVLYQQAGDRHGEANALNILARVQQVAGDFPAAVTTAEQACALFQQVGGRRGEATSLDILARVRGMTGDLPAAVAAARRAHSLHEHVGNRHGQANTLNTLAHLQHVTGDSSAAAATADRARRLHEQLGTRQGEATALHLLAIARLATGDYRAAASTARRAHALFQRIEDRLGLANAVQILGIVQHAAGDHAAATQTLAHALTLFRDVGDPDGEAETLNHIGQLELDTAGASAARRRFAAALAIARVIGTPTHEARALEGIGHCLIGEGLLPDGVRQLRCALAIYQRIQSPNTARVVEALARHNGAQSPYAVVPVPESGA